MGEVIQRKTDGIEGARVVQQSSDNMKDVCRVSSVY